MRYAIHIPVYHITAESFISDMEILHIEILRAKDGDVFPGRNPRNLQKFVDLMGVGVA